MTEMSEAQFKAAKGRISTIVDELTAAIDHLRSLRDTGKLPRAYANAQIDSLRDRRSDYEDLEASLNATTPVTSIPSDAEVQGLAAAVAKLAANNVTEVAARGAVNEIVTIVGTASALGQEVALETGPNPNPKAPVAALAVVAVAAIGLGIKFAIRQKR